MPDSPRHALLASVQSSLNGAAGPAARLALEVLLGEVSRAVLNQTDGPALDPFRVTLARANKKHTISYGAGTTGDNWSGADPLGLALLDLLLAHFLSPLECEVVLALEEGPQSHQAVLRRFSGGETKLKETRAELVRRGVLRQTEDGYELADPRYAAVARALSPANSSQQ